MSDRLEAAEPPSPSLFGGDRAGLSATFSSVDGTLVPVPNHMVPEAMIEWGAIPSSLEILASEDVVVAEGGGRSERGPAPYELVRTTVTILPETGCGIENLETTRTVDRFSSECVRTFDGGDGARPVIAMDRPPPNFRPTPRVSRRVDIETAFETAPEVSDGDCDENLRRVRVSFSVEFPPPLSEAEAEGGGSAAVPSMSALVTLRVERRTSPTSTAGTIANGGGLDARTVTGLIGDAIWKGDVLATKTTAGESAGTQEASVDEGAKITTLRLPQNIIMRYGFGLCAPVVGSMGDGNGEGGRWGVEVSHVGTVIGSESDGGTAASLPLRRQIVLRTYDVAGDTPGDTSGGGDNVRYWVKEKYEAN